MIKPAFALLAALTMTAPALAQTGQTGPAAPTATAPAPKVAAKQQVGLPAPRKAPKKGPALSKWSLADAGKKDTQLASTKAGPAVPPPVRIKVPKTKAPQTRTAERKKPRVNAASQIASTVRRETRN